MRKCVVILISFFSVIAHAEPTPIPPIISKLLSVKGPVQIYSVGETRWVDIVDLPVIFKYESQHLLKSGDGIYVTIPGTGRLYKAIFENNMMSFKRIDSTFFNGYNFNSISFTIKNQIYNFGGEGYWQTNGTIRIYDTIFKEWNAIKLNKSVHRSYNRRFTDNAFFDVDTANQTLTINGNPANQEYLKQPYMDSIYIKKLFRLDLKNGDWTDIGLMNFKIDYELAYTPYGILTGEYVIDVTRNKKYKHDLNFPLTAVLGNSSNDHNFSISFCIDSTIYFGNASQKIDSIQISRKNLIDEGELAFFPIKSSLVSSENTPLLSLFLGGLIAIVIIIFKFSRRKSKRIEVLKTNKLINIKHDEEMLIDLASSDQALSYRSGTLIELLSPQQINCLNALYQQSLAQRMTTIQEINKVIGSQHKSIEIQKKMRSDIINGINDKASILFNTKSLLIDKQRSDFDKRSFEYFIRPENMNIAKDLIQTKG